MTAAILAEPEQFHFETMLVSQPDVFIENRPIEFVFVGFDLVPMDRNRNCIECIFCRTRNNRIARRAIPTPPISQFIEPNLDLSGIERPALNLEHYLLCVLAAGIY